MATRVLRKVPSQPYLLPPGESQDGRTRARVSISDGRLFRAVRAYISAARDLELLKCGGDTIAHDADVTVVSLVGAAPGSVALEAPSGTRLLAIVPRETDELLLDAVSLGAWALVPLDAPPQTLISTVRRVHLGECPILAAMSKRPRAAAGLLHRLGVAGAVLRANPAPPNPLTEREIMILAGVATGSNSGRIAGKLGLREQTVKNYVTEILQKVGARSRAQAAALAVKHGWLDAVE